jgi:hypothetical protein
MSPRRKRGPEPGLEMVFKRPSGRVDAALRLTVAVAVVDEDLSSGESGAKAIVAGSTRHMAMRSWTFMVMISISAVEDLKFTSG